MFPAFAYARPQHLQDAVAQLVEGKAMLHAGGTDLLGCLRDEVFTTDTVVSLAGIEGLNRISQRDDGGLIIGALTTLTAIAEHPTVKQRYPGLAAAAAAVGSPQLRNQGTLAGNLCQKPRCWYYRGDFPCLRKGGHKCYAVNGDNRYHCIFGGANCFIVHPSDTAPALASLDAEVRVIGPQGARRIAVADLHMDPADNPTRETVLEQGEIIVQIDIPAPAAGLYSRYRKIRTRQAWDFAIAGCALALQMDGNTVGDCRVFLAGAAPIPWRSQATEAVLRGQELTPALIEQAAAASVANAVPMTANGYKVPLFKGMLIEELGMIMG